MPFLHFLSAPVAARLVNHLIGCTLLLLGATAIAQVCATPGKDSAVTSIAGVINSYYPGTAGLVAAGAVTLPKTSSAHCTRVSVSGRGISTRVLTVKRSPKNSW